MAAAPCFSLILLLLCTLIVAATGGGPINITRILEKAGQYTKFIRLLNISQTADQINNQVNNFNDLTVFAPTDNAFDNLPAGTLNMLPTQQQVQLVLYHICPRYYSLTDLTSVRNPVRTQASGKNGVEFGLYFTGQSNQVNVSTGVVDAPIHNVLKKDFPLAVYQVDKVLLPKELFEAKAPSGTKSGGFSSSKGGDATAPSTHNSEKMSPSAAPMANGTISNGGDATAPSTHNSKKISPSAAPTANGTNSDGGDATAPSAAPTADGTKSGGSRSTDDGGVAMAPSTHNSGKMSAGVGLVTAALLCMGLLS